jgi:transcriptional regulator with XRE-family HTH domain
MTPAEEELTVARVRSWLRAGRARAIRRRAGMSQADVARAIGTDTSRISRWESATTVPVHDSALRLARLYDNLEKIIREEDAAAGKTA